MSQVIVNRHILRHIMPIQGFVGGQKATPDTLRRGNLPRNP